MTRGGYNKGNLGKKFTEEHKRKIGLKHKGKLISEEHKQKISLYMTSRIGSLNHHWKGDLVGVSGVHQWVRKNLTQPEKCQMCDDRPVADLANITGIYKRDFENWKYLCRKCHMVSDGRLDKLHELRRRKIHAE